jgi:HlyD family secretion protein
METKFGSETSGSNSVLPSWLKSPKILLTVLVGLLASAGLGGYAISALQNRATSPTAGATASPSPVAVPKPTTVTALGRLEPQGEVIRIAAPENGSRVAELRVRQGDRVQPRQIIAVLDSRDRLQAALERAKEQVSLAQAKLAQIQAGAKQGDIAAQSATVNRLAAELKNAQSEYRRYQVLYRQGAISASMLDSKRLIVDTTQAQLNQARQTRSSVAEVRPVDVRVAEVEVKNAIAAVRQAQADLDLAYVRAPRAGQILKVHTWAGEVVGDDGIVELGRTGQMYVVAQVYESDFKRVQMGQAATISSDAFTGTLQGRVSELGLQIFKQDVLDTDPTAAADARVVEVRIRLDPDSSRRVANLTNLEVTVQIGTGS